jgi:Trypsin
VSRRLIRCVTAAGFVVAVFVGSSSSAVEVVGGSMIQIQASPWTVFVAFDSGSTQYRCTGSVIDASHVLTAAHCLYDESSGALATPSAITIRGGISNFASPAPTDIEQDRAVGSFRIHPGYVNNGMEVPDDVAVLALAAPLDLSGPAVQAVALPAPNAPFPAGATVAIAGFGRQIPAVTGSGPLDSMTATVDPQGACGEDAREGPIEDNAVLLCAVSPTSTVCNGDSGSGVVTTGGTPVLVGVMNAVAPGCPLGSHGASAYLGATEILAFVQGNDRPPMAPRASSLTSWGLDWGEPLVVGSTLTCSTSGWGQTVSVSYSFVDAASGQVLQTGPHASYPIPPTGVHTTIFCEAAVSDSGGTTLVKTVSTSKVKPPPPLKIERLAPLSARRGQDVTLHVVLRSAPGLSGRLSACAVLPAAVGGRLCRSTRQAAGVAVDSLFTLTFRIRPTAPLGTARVAISAGAGSSTAKAVALLRISKA